MSIIVAPSVRWLRAAVAVLATMTTLAASCTGSTPGPQAEQPDTRRPAEVDRSEAQLGDRIDAFFAASLGNYYRGVRAVVVLASGHPVVDQAYRSPRTYTRDVHTVTDTVLSTLVGVALAEHRLRSLDQTLAQLLPAYRPVMRPQVAGITLEQLLTMTAGLPLDPQGGALPAFMGSRDWVRSILRRGTDRPPGSEFGYSSATAHLVAAVLVAATGQSVLAYARATLFDPLRVDSRPASQPLAVGGQLHRGDSARFGWPVDPQGIHVGFRFLQLTAADVAKLGRLYLDGGRWHGEQLVPASWIRAATTVQVPIERANLQRLGEDPDIEGYGFLWWITRVGDHLGFAATGWGGQLLEVVPARRLVVVFASHTGGALPAVQADHFLTLVSGLIAPALDPS